MDLSVPYEIYYQQAQPFQPWPVMSGSSYYGHPGEPRAYLPCEAVFYDAESQPQVVVEKLKRVEVHQSLSFGKRVDRGTKGRVVGPRLVSQRKSVWLPKKAGGDGVLTSSSTVHGKALKRSGRVVPFPTTVDEVQRSGTTTVMIKNIPNQFTREILLSILDKHCRDENQKADSLSCKSAFDFVYLPMDFMKCWNEGKTANLGYAFVNFTNAVAAFRFFNSFHKRVWEVAKNKKTCEVTVADIQGKEALSESFKTSRFWCKRNSFLPVVLEPPRDGSNSCEFMTVGEHVPCAPPKHLRKTS
ncbi:hypothetical protein RGQ29_031088 [Quercus rubra]|uniref:Mei2-like C-terminal RNA recognition motif domain-containing protein n=1 Tax=Quercus rubra TaxID=3512 RepID=A0AAN7EL52_QUERU|nr:hypothetical protein RGQ29_031088 [Quercus rubra]